MTEQDIPGATAAGGLSDRELAGVRDLLAAHVPEAGPLRASLLAGSRSNLTYALTDGTHHWVLRRPPLGHVLATAHDMGREYRVLRALAPTAVPVPRRRPDEPAVRPLAEITGRSPQVAPEQLSTARARSADRAPARECGERRPGRAPTTRGGGRE